MTTKQSVGYHSIVALFSPTETNQSAAIRATNIAAKLHSQVTLAYIAGASDSDPAHESDDAISSRINQLMTEQPEIVLTKRAQGSLLEIVPMADEVSGDLIVLDAGIHGQLYPLLLENHETACAQGECDALVVHTADGGNNATTDYRHIVVAADLNDQGLMTIYKAVRMAKRYNARLTLLNVLDSVPTGDAKEADAAQRLRLRGLEAFTSVIEGLEVEKTVLATSASVDQAVSEYSMQQKADLIVIGSHKFRGLCVLLGSTAKRVIESAHCDVLVVHE